jgi:hypothetical protein
MENNSFFEWDGTNGFAREYRNNNRMAGVYENNRFLFFVVVVMVGYIKAPARPELLRD